MKFQIPETFYKSLFDNMTDGLAYCQMVFDARENPVDWIYIKVNKNFEKMTGLKNAEGKKVSKLIPGIGASNPELFEIYGQVSLTGKPKEFETYVKPLSRWFSVSVFSPQKNFFVALFQNITNRKQIEKNLEDAKIAAINVLDDLNVEKSRVEIAQAKDEAILSSIGDGIIATGPDRRIIIMNKVAEMLLGWKINEAIGKLYDDIVLLEDENGTFVLPENKPLQRAFAQGTTTTTTTTVLYLLSKNKIKFPVAITVSPIILGNKIIGAVEVFRDITKEKEIDKAKTEFVSLASHQLKTPPTAIKLLTERMLSGKTGKLTEKQKEYLDDIYSENQRSIELVNALLNVSRIEMGAFTIQLSEKNICAIVQSVIYELKSAINKKQLRLEEIHQQKNISLLIDEPLFRMVLSNLIMNAVNYTAEGGTIHIECKEVNKGEALGEKLLAENSFVIVVSDTGYGIPKNQQNKLFTKFFRADNAREKHTDGTGLGLYIVKSTLDNSGGSVWFTSEENKGTTFYVAIPMTGMKAKIGKKELVDI